MPIEQSTQTEFNKWSCRWCDITSMFIKLHDVIGSQVEKSKQEMEWIFLEIIKENFKTLMENKTKLNYRFTNLNKPQRGEIKRHLYKMLSQQTFSSDNHNLGSRWQKTLKYPPEVLKKKQQPQQNHQLRISVLENLCFGNESVKEAVSHKDGNSMLSK